MTWSDDGWDVALPAPEPLPRNIRDMPLAVAKVAGMILILLFAWRMARG